VHLRAGGFALPVMICIAVAVASCSTAPGTVESGISPSSPSPAGSTVASPSAGSVPAGYTRVGGAAQGISVAAPASWVAVNLARESIESAASRTGLKGISANTLVQLMESLQKQHPVIVFDVKSAEDSPRDFARNLNAYCIVSGVDDVGAAGVPLLKTEAAAGFKKLNATNVTQRDLEIGGVPGVETSYQLNSSSAGTIYGSQLEVLPKPDKACFVTLTVVQGQSAGNILDVAAATARFP
jgi:hypothetical protein